RLGEGIVERIDIFREEAVLRDENNSLFRSRADDILTAVAGEALAAAMPAAAAPVYESPLDEETEKALKKLEDSETAN
ncbi:MAG TPA: hypothetical protein VN285_09040, partial [Candidatus Deferrimicrobium sp.]|nr:hypothetical protein [Candidatus Deferrimicrobium sp.]